MRMVWLRPEEGEGCVKRQATNRTESKGFCSTQPKVSTQLWPCLTQASHFTALNLYSPPQNGNHLHRAVDEVGIL